VDIPFGPTRNSFRKGATSEPSSAPIALTPETPSTSPVFATTEGPRILLSTAPSRSPARPAYSSGLVLSLERGDRSTSTSAPTSGGLVIVLLKEEKGNLRTRSPTIGPTIAHTYT
jgi:hypothetical protein